MDAHDADRNAVHANATRRHAHDRTHSKHADCCRRRRCQHLRRRRIRGRRVINVRLQVRQEDCLTRWTSRIKTSKELVTIGRREIKPLGVGQCLTWFVG